MTIIGDTTAGGFGTSVYRELPNGWSYRMTTSLISEPDGTTYEGQGIPPDIVQYLTPVDVRANVDSQLNRAIDFLRDLR